MPESTQAQLVAALTAVDKEPVVLCDASGASLVVLPYGGRVLGLFSNQLGENFLWTHSALADPVTARELYESDRWHNSGGDRTWLAPERDFFYPDFPDTSRYVQPKQFDAGKFVAAASSREVVLSTEFDLCSHRTGVDLHLRLSKEVSFAKDPLRRWASQMAGHEWEFAGYRLVTKLQNSCALEGEAAVGIWNLLQLPGGGDMFAPTYERTEPTIFFGTIPPGDIAVDDRYVRYHMSAPGEQKICISSLAATGRLGYIRRADTCWTLVVRNFFLDPAAEYRDVWPTRPTDDGYAVQICNINAAYLGYFAEMEYHAPTLVAQSNELISEDVSDVWAYRGSPAMIQRAARLLLGVDVPT